MSVSDWSATADENTSIDGINIAEHCPAKNMNDALRAVMAAVKNESDALQSDLGTYLRKSGGTMTGALTLADGSTAEGVVGSEYFYVRYASGLQICWGSVNCVNYTYSNKHSIFTYPVSFKDFNYQITVCPLTSYADVVSNIDEKETTYCSVGVRNIRQSTDNWSVNVLIHAIGYWK